MNKLASTGTAACFLSGAMILALLSGQQAFGGQIYSDANDGFLEVRDNLPPQGQWPTVHSDTFGSWNASVGEWYGPGLTTIVLPFELPDFGAVNDPFDTADLGVQVFEKGDSTVTNIDLYGVRVAADPAISTADWYNGSAPDANADLIQAGFLTPASPVAGAGVPNNFTDAAGDVALMEFLNDAYAGGANAGQFVFLRLSYASDTLASGWDAYKITVREAALPTDAPVITYDSSFSVVPEPSSIAMLGLLSAVVLTQLQRSRRS